MIDEKRLQQSIDRSEIIDLVSKSILTRDSGWWEQLVECYHSEAEFTSSWWQGKAKDFVNAAAPQLEASKAEGGEQKHMTANHWIEIKGDRAIAECDLILYTRTPIKGIELDFATWSRRLHLMARENGEWKIWRRVAIYERDRMDPVDPTIAPETYLDRKAMEKYPKQIRYHLWRNSVKAGSEPSKNICIRGTDEEKKVRSDARTWIEGA
jgi:hypothetical protein